MDLFTVLVLLSMAAMVLGWKVGYRQRRPVSVNSWFGTIALHSQRTQRRSGTPTLEAAPYPQPKDEVAATPISSLAQFNWKRANPKALRPFKPVYHITMGRCPSTRFGALDVANSKKLCKPIHLLSSSQWTVTTETG